MIKIIDFGLSHSHKYSLNFGHWINNRPFIQELDDFIYASSNRFFWQIPVVGRVGKLANQMAQTLYAEAYPAINEVSNNQDIRMFNSLLLGLWHILALRGSLLPDQYYCEDYDACIQLVSKWWK